MGTRVWIESGCIQCNWCSDLAPEVFVVTAGGSHVRGDARVDGVTDTNARLKVVLAALLDETRRDFLEFVAGGCPADVIRIASEV